MAKDTVFNKWMAIATKGSAHVARSLGSIDECHEINDETSTHLDENYVATHPNLDPDTNTSRRTVINGYRIWIDKGHVATTDGRLKSEPEHQPWIVGVHSGEHYRNVAWNTTCSENVKAEKRGVVRSFDTTRQNHDNCDGWVDGSQVDVTLELTEDFYAKCCQISAVEGQKQPFEGSTPEQVWEDEANEAVDLGREVPGAGVRDFLMIHDGDTVSFTATRLDTTQTPHVTNPPCKLNSDHSHWTSTRTGLVEAAEGPEGTGDAYSIGPELTDVGLELSSSSSFEAPEVMGKKRHEKGLAARFGMSGTQVGLADIVRFFRAGTTPPVVEVKAAACAGTRTVKLPIKPRGRANFSFAFENEGTDLGKQKENDKKLEGCPALSELVLLVRSANDMFAFFRELDPKGAANLAGPTKFVEGRCDISLLTGVTIELGCSYKRCTKDGTGLGNEQFTPAHIRRAWYFGVTGKIFDVDIGVEIDLVQICIRTCGGPAGVAAGELLKFLDLKVLTLDFGVAMGLDARAVLGVDQHDEFIGGRDSRFILSITLHASLALDLYVGSASIRFEGTATGSLGVHRSDQPGFLCKCDLDIAFTSQVILTGKIWRYTAQKAFAGPSWTPSGTERYLEIW